MTHAMQTYWMTSFLGTDIFKTSSPELAAKVHVLANAGTEREEEVKVTISEDSKNGGSKEFTIGISDGLTEEEVDILRSTYQYEKLTQMQTDALRESGKEICGICVERMTQEGGNDPDFREATVVNEFGVKTCEACAEMIKSWAGNRYAKAE